MPWSITVARVGGTAVITELADMTIPLAIVAQSTLDGNLGGDVMFMELLRGDWQDGRLVFLTANESPMAIACFVERIGDGIALEPQKFPDAPNHPDFVTARVDPGKPYRHVMIYRLSTAR